MQALATLLLLAMTSSACGAASVVDCDFEMSLCGYTGNINTPHQWTRNSGPTGSSNTGPPYDHTFMNATGHYMYVEASNVAHGTIVDMISHPFTITPGANVTFFYHMYGGGIGTLSVMLRSENGAGGHNDTRIWHRSDEAGPEWQEANITMPVDMSDSPVNLVFRVSIGTSYLSDIAVDDISMALPPVPTTTAASTVAMPSTPRPPKTTNVSVKVTGDVSILASPGSVHENFTKFLTINCTYNHGPDSDFSTLVSLLLSVTSGGVTKEVATITAFSNDVVQIKNGLGAKIVGYLHADQTSYITLRWLYPGDQVIGKYRCEGFGLDHSGHPRTSEMEATITQKALDCDADVLPGFKATDVTLDALEVKVDTSRKSFFPASTTYNNHTYYLSGAVTRNIQMAADLCGMYGGHLAELTSQDEFEAVVNYTESVISGGDYGIVALGGTDKGHEDQWTLLTSGANMTYFAWADQEPTRALYEDCLFLTGSPRMKMNDGACEGASLIRVLCEVEE